MDWTNSPGGVAEASGRVEHHLASRRVYEVSRRLHELVPGTGISTGQANGTRFHRGAPDVIYTRF